MVSPLVRRPGMVRMSSLTRKATLPVVLVILVFVPAEGQTISGSISGTVVDPQQGSISGAAVTLTEASKGLTFETRTNGAGGFVFAQAPPGNYTLKVETAGFKKLEPTGVVLNANDTLNVG